MGYLNLTGLSRFLGKLQTALGSKLDKNQGTANAGKVLCVSSTGEVTPETMDSGFSIGEVVGNVYLDDESTGSVQDFEYFDEEESEIVNRRYYAGRITLYTMSGSQISDISLSQYRETARGGSLIFHNTVLSGTSMIQISWSVRPDDEEADVVCLKDGTKMTMEALIEDLGMTSCQLTVYEV